VGIYGNEQADRLSEDAACSTDIAVIFGRIPKSTLYSELEEEATQIWQEEWEKFTKAAATKQFFPNVRDRINLSINVKPEFYGNVNWTWENQGLSPQIQDSGKCNMPLQQGRPNIRPYI